MVQSRPPECPSCGRKLFHRHRDSRFSTEEIFEILDSTKSVSALANEHEVSQSLVSRIRAGKRYQSDYLAWRNRGK